MNDILKQRLVGALILLALGVVFWPIIFVQPQDASMPAQQQIPPRPEVSTAPIDAPDASGYRSSPAPSLTGEEEYAEVEVVAEDAAAEVEPAQVAAPAEDSGARSASPEPLVVDSDGVPVAWILQVASVSSKDKAEQLRQRLVAMNIKAYVQTLQSAGKKLYRVYVGPKVERAKLEQLQPEIDAEFGVSSIVARYTP